MKTIVYSNIPDYLVDDSPLTDASADGWKPFTYELDAFSGTGLYTGAHSPAGELTLDLGLKGWQKISLAHNPSLRVQIEGEPGYWELPGAPSTIGEASLPPLNFGEGKKLKIAPVRDLARSLQVTLFFLKAEAGNAPDSNPKKLIATTTDTAYSVPAWTNRKTFTATSIPSATVISSDSSGDSMAATP